MWWNILFKPQHQKDFEYEQRIKHKALLHGKAGTENNERLFNRTQYKDYLRRKGKKSLF